MHDSLSIISLQSFHRVNVTVSMHMISLVDSELTGTCTGKENKTFVFVFDVFHEDFMTK